MLPEIDDFTAKGNALFDHTAHDGSWLDAALSDARRWQRKFLELNQVVLEQLARCPFCMDGICTAEAHKALREAVRFDDWRSENRKG